MRFLGAALEATASHWPLAKGAGWFMGAPLKWMKVGCPADVPAADGGGVAEIPRA